MVGRPPGIIMNKKKHHGLRPLTFVKLRYRVYKKADPSRFKKAATHCTTFINLTQHGSLLKDKHKRGVVFVRVYCPGLRPRPHVPV